MKWILLFCLSVCILYAKAQNITKAEFFFDADPGPGKGLPVPVNNPGTTVNLSFTASTTGLSAGFHSLNFRTRMGDSTWGHYESRSFFISGSTTNATGINRAEFFIDTDPGAGKGIPMNIGVAGRTVNFTSPFIALTNLQPGFHTLCVRTRDAEKKWGFYEARSFFISGNVANSPNITAAESFVDIDPGPGLGAPITVGTNGTTVNFTASIPTASLTQGFHFLSIRTKGADGKWGHFETRGFYVTAAANNLPNIVAGEFFLDVDPGVGNGFKLPITTPAATVNEGFICDIPANTPSGDHMLFIRVQNLDGHWSHWDSVLVTVDASQSPSSITCTPANLTPCRNSTFNVNFSTSGLFGVARNVFTAQLSDANGSFANPVVIGTKNSLPSGVNTPNSISVTIPANMPNGTNYRIRILSSAPAFSGDTSTALRIMTPGRPTITANRPIVFCEGDSVVLTSSPASSFLWSNGASTQSIIVKASGKFSLTVFNAAGCLSSAADSVTVTVNSLPAKPTISANRPLTFCLGDSVILRSSEPTNIRWSTGATSVTIKVKTGNNNFAVTSTNANGCQNTSDSTRVTVNSLPPVPIIDADKPFPITFCDGDSVTLRARIPGGLLWSNGAISPSIKVKTNETITVTKTNGNGCKSTSLPTVVTVKALPAVPIVIANKPTTICNGDSVLLTANTNVGLLWSTNDTSQSITVKTAGPFFVTTTNADGCKATSASTSLTVNPVPATPRITISQGSNAICQGDSIILKSSAIGGNVWSNGATTDSIVVKTAGAFSVKVTSNFGCTSASSSVINVTVNALPPVPTISIIGSTTFCLGDSVTLRANAGSNIVWSTEESTRSIVVKTSGSFNVTRSNANGCKATSLPVVVTANPLPPIPTITPNGPTTFCDGDSVELTSNATISNLWSNNDTTQSIKVKVNGNFLVTAIDLNGCKTTSLPTTVVVNPIPPTPTISITGNTTFCQGDSVTLTSEAASGNVWSNGETSQSIKVRTSGTFTVSVNLLGCSSPLFAPVIVTVNQVPPTPTISSSKPLTFCNGDSVILRSSAAVGNVWSNGDTSRSITVKNSSSFTVTKINSTGCSATSAPTVVTVNPIPATPTITVVGNTTFCQGDSVMLISSDATGNEWSNGAITQSIKVKTTGTFSVISSALGCSSAASVPVSVVVNPIPATPTVTASGPTTFCSGSSVTLTSSATSGNVWSTGAISNTLRVTTGGSFSVRATALGCSSLASIPVVVTVNSLPAKPTISANGPTTFCQGDSVLLIANVSTGIKWSTKETTQIIKVKTGAKFTVTRTGANGCTNTSLVTLVTVNPLPATPTISPSGIQSICQGESLILTSSPSSIYVWSTGAISQSITISNAGNFSVKVKDANGCTSLESSVTTVSVKPLPTVNAITGTANVCIGSTRQLSNTTIGGVWSSLSPGIATVSSSGIVKGISAGTAMINYTVTGINGCSKSASFSMGVNSLPSITNIIGDTSVCQGSTTRLANLTGGGTWSSSKTGTATISSTGVVTGISSGTTAITYKVGPNSNGCSSVVTMNFTVHGQPSVGTITGNTTVCVGRTIQLSISTPIGSWFSSNGNATVNISSGLVTGVQVGTSTITFRSLINSFGCSNTTSKIVTILAPCFAIAKASLIEPIATETMKVSIYPNPTGNVFNVQVKAPKQESINIRVLDVNGKTAFAAKGMPGQVFHFGEQLKAGTYLVEVRQGEEVITVKAVKVRQ